jgi:N-glycosylase/DNA lyase
VGDAGAVNPGNNKGRNLARKQTCSVSTSAWSAWRRVNGAASFSLPVLRELLDGGQAFRWSALSATEWLGVWGRNVVRLRLNDAGGLQWSAPSQLADATAPALHRYLGADTDFAAATDALPWRSDPHLAGCLAAFPGLRILRQPFGETLLCFLCSATKQIVQIKQMVALLAERFGDALSRADIGQTPPPAVMPSPRTVHALPTWDRLATIPEPELRGCLLGFRARYIAETARFLAQHPGWLEETEMLPYADAKVRLCTLPGVGEKVADCVLLFGAGRLEAFPVDVWILRTMATRYALHDWKPAQLVQFGRAHFGPYAGLAQQYLFAWERMTAKAGGSNR